MQQFSFAIFSLSPFFYLSIYLSHSFSPFSVPAPFFPSASPRLSVCPLANVVSWQWFVDLMGRKGAPTLYKVVGTARNRWRWGFYNVVTAAAASFVRLFDSRSGLSSFLFPSCLSSLLFSSPESAGVSSFLPSIHQTRRRNKIDNAVAIACVSLYIKANLQCAPCFLLFFFSSRSLSFSGLKFKFRKK